MKPLVIYHASCADGFGAAFAAWLKLGDEVEYVPVSYGEVGVGQLAGEFGQFRLCTKNNVIEVKDREIYILDFSFSQSVMEELFANAKRVVWLDHHKTAFEMWGIPTGQHVYVEGDKHCYDTPRHYIKLHNDKSGAVLAWEFFHPDAEVPMLIKHIDDYDRWQFKLKGTKEINKALWSYAPWGFTQWLQLIEDSGFSANDGTGIDAWYREGTAILHAHNQNVQSVVKGAARKCLLNPAPITGAGIEGLAANCSSHLTSDVGHELATKSGTFGLCWTLGKKGLVASCSLRSNGDYDVSAIAKAFGGGGHKNVAGFEVDIQTLLGWLK